MLRQVCTKVIFNNHISKLMSNKEIDQAIRDKRLYFVGERLPSDWYEAFRLWLPLAEAGDAKAQYNIGRCYSRGDGTDKDLKKAEEWYLKAAAQNEPRSHHNLSLDYSDLQEAEKSATWHKKAVEIGEPRALYLAGEECMQRGDKEGARVYFQKALDGGNMFAQVGLTACDVEITFTHSTKKNYYTYTEGVTSSLGHVSGGGTRTGTYNSPIIIFKAKNNSQKEALLSVITQQYDGENPEKKIGNSRRLDFPSLAPGEIAEAIYEIYEKESPLRVYYTGYTVWEVRDAANPNDEKWEYFQFPQKVLAWESKKKESGCFVLTACYGDHDAPTVKIYRQFRDNYLAKHVYGRRFITWYYTHGPKWAKSLSLMPKSRAVLRQLFKIISYLLPRQY